MKQCGPHRQPQLAAGLSECVLADDFLNLAEPRGLAPEVAGLLRSAVGGGSCARGSTGSNRGASTHSRSGAFKNLTRAIS